MEVLQEQKKLSIDVSRQNKRIIADSINSVLGIPPAWHEEDGSPLRSLQGNTTIAPSDSDFDTEEGQIVQTCSLIGPPRLRKDTSQKITIERFMPEPMPWPTAGKSFIEIHIEKIGLEEYNSFTYPFIAVTVASMYQRLPLAVSKMPRLSFQAKTGVL